MTIKWGILGTANIALTRTIPFMAHVECADAEAIASRTLDKARQAVAREQSPPIANTLLLGGNYRGCCSK
ncbi:MAG: hypothetical protein OEQ18_10240 [Gammaproteobacteria bacterium]|nr:hypothetical protein [Gammaproteobacteria bacterium]